MFLIIFIISNFLNIYADEKEKSYIKDRNTDDVVIARYIFIITLFVSLLIYLYLLFSDLKEEKELDFESKENFDIKIFGNIFIIVGLICLLYFQIKDKNVLSNAFS